MQWFSRGALSRRKVVTAALGMAPIAAAAAFVTEPILLLSLTGAVIAGYAATTTIHIGPVRAQLGR